MRHAEGKAAFTVGTWRLRAMVRSTHAAQQIPKPTRRSSRRPDFSTMKTWAKEKRAQSFRDQLCINEVLSSV